MAAGRSPQVEDDAIVEVVRSLPEEGRLPSTSDVTTAVNEQHGAEYDRKTVYRRLSGLEEEGRILKVEVGAGRGKSVGWYAPDSVQIEFTPNMGAPPSERRTFDEQPQDVEPDEDRDEEVLEATGMEQWLYHQPASGGQSKSPIERLATRRTLFDAVLFFVVSMVSSGAFVHGVTTPGAIPPTVLPLFAGVGFLALVTAVVLFAFSVLARIALGTPWTELWGRGGEASA